MSDIDKFHSAPSWGNRLIGMEGLRGLAALTVMMGHVQSHLAAGVNFGSAGKILGLLVHGLTLFFALSGFLLFRSFANAILSGSTFPNVRRFYANRALRIFPAYLVIFALVSFVFGAAYTSNFKLGQGIDDTPQYVGYISDPLLIASNLFIVQTFFPFSLKTGLGVAWSLTVESVFYLVLPLLSIFAWKLRRDRRDGFWHALVPIIIILAIGTIGKVVMTTTFRPVDGAESFYMQWGGNWHAVFARSFMVHADLFVFGMLAALLLAAFETGRLPHKSLGVTQGFALLIGVATVILSHYVGFGPWSDTASAVAFGALILIVALPSRTGKPGLLARTLDIPPISFMGLFHIASICGTYRLSGFSNVQIGWRQPRPGVTGLTS